MGPHFPWCFNDHVVREKESDDFQFTFMLYYHGRSSEYFHLVSDIIEYIKPKSLLRVKVNLTTKTPEPKYFDYHRDFQLEDPNAQTSIFYINSNNGATCFRDGSEIKSEANKMVTFHLLEEHRGKTCTDEKRRVLINFNYLK